MKEKFGLIRAPSPGTIYPRLRKLLFTGDITGKDEEYKISPQGKQKLTQNVPDIIDNSLEFMPMLYKILMRPLPFGERMNYLSNISCFSEHSGHAPHRNFLDDSIFPEECQCTSDFSESIGRLQAIKDRLLRAKQEIQERLSTRLQAIDEKIQFIDEKIKECQVEKENRVKIPIEDGDSKTE
jgi:DNA-binding PadR family transcriptional regulator